MHKTALTLFVCTSHLSAMANIPDCWNVNPDTHKKGSYTISIKTSNLTGLELTKIFEDVLDGSVGEKTFPLAIDNSIYFNVNANPEYSKKQVEETMRRIQKHKGVSIACTTLSHLADL